MSAYIYLTLFTHGGVDRSLLHGEFAPEASVLLPEEIRDDCLVLSSSRQERSIGDFHYASQEVTFRLRDELLAEVRDCLLACYELLLTMEKPKRYDFVNQYLPAFLQEDFPQLDFSPEHIADMDDQLARMPDNYFLRRWNGVHEQVVYSGWPFEKKRDRSIYLNLFTILSTQDKIGEYPPGEVEFINMAEGVKARLQERFRIARYAYIMGF